MPFKSLNDSRHSHPGSISIKPFEEIIPEYMRVDIRTTGPDEVHAGIGGGVDESLERYNENKYFAAVADFIFDHFVQLDSDDPRSSFEELHRVGKSEIGIYKDDLMAGIK